MKRTKANLIVRIDSEGPGFVTAEDIEIALSVLLEQGLPVKRKASMASRYTASIGEVVAAHYVNENYQPERCNGPLEANESRHVIGFWDD